MLQSRILYSTRLSVIFKRIWLEITKSQMRKLTGQGKDTVKRSQPHTYDIKTSNYDKRRVQMEERRTEFEIKRPSSVDGHLDYFQNLTIMNNAAVTISSIHFSSVTQSCLTLCNPMDCSKPGVPAHHQPLELAQTHVHWIGDAIQHLILCHPLLFLCLQYFPASGTFPMSKFFTSGGQSIGVSASK